MKNNYAGLKEFCLQQGADIFSVADISAIKHEFAFAKRTLEEFDRGVCLGVRLSSSILQEITDEPTMLYFHHYRAVNVFLDQLAIKACNYMQAKGYAALPVPASQILDWENQTAHLSHKKLGVLSGIGWIGRNNLLVNDRLGSHFRLVTILTEMPLDADKPLAEDCGSCRACVVSCPAQAIKENFLEFDHKKCFEKLKNFQRKRMVDQYICGVCVSVCSGRKKPDG
jgi:epoxyqueuosine reductase